MRDITLQETVDFFFTTAEPDTGAPATLSGTPVISAYVGNSTTQITAGITLDVDFDTTTGLNHVRVVATAANGYTTGTDVALIITTGTVDAVSAVGYKVAEFTIGRGASLALRPTVAGRTFDVAATGEGGIDLANANVPVGAIPWLGIMDNGVAQSAAGTAATLRAAAAFAADDLIGMTYVSGNNSRVISDNDGTDGVTLASAFTSDPGAAQYFIHSSPPGSNFQSSLADGAITAAKIATDAFTAAKFAADAGTEIGTAVWASTTRQLTGTQTFNVTGNITGNLSGSVGSVTGAVGSVASGGITAASFGANAINAAKLDPDVTTELQSGLATAAAVADLPTNAELTTALAAADDAVLAAIAALNNLSAAQVNAEMVDALATDTYAEPGQGAPAATATLAAKLNYLYKFARNRKTQTATEFAIYADDGTTKDHEAAVSSDGTTLVVGELATGA